MNHCKYLTFIFVSWGLGWQWAPLCLWLVSVNMRFCKRSLRSDMQFGLVDISPFFERKKDIPSYHITSCLMSMPFEILSCSCQQEFSVFFVSLSVCLDQKDTLSPNISIWITNYHVNSNSKKAVNSFFPSISSLSYRRPKISLIFRLKLCQTVRARRTTIYREVHSLHIYWNPLCKLTQHSHLKWHINSHMKLLLATPICRNKSR